MGACLLYTSTGYSMTKQEMEQTVAILKKHAAANPDKNLTFCLDVSYICLLYTSRCV